MPIVDFAILTGLTEEFEVLRNIFPEFTEQSENADVWYRTRVKGKAEKNYEIVAAFQNEMGPLDAQDLTRKVINRWDPAAIILVGIAGSFVKDVKLGDVIVSQQIFHYDPGKATSKKIQYRPQGYPCSTVLIRQTEALRLNKEVFNEWQQEARDIAAKMAEGLKGKDKDKERVQLARKILRAHRPEIHFGTVASGHLVITDKKKQKELLSLHGKIIGTEMEGAGVLHATFRQELPTPAIVIKGISDAADKNKDREDAKGYWRELAKENPVRLVLELIKRGQIRPLQTDQFNLDSTAGTIEDARNMIRQPIPPMDFSLKVFPHLITPKGPLTRLGIDITVLGAATEGIRETLDINHLVVQYIDREGTSKKEEIERSSVEIDKPISASPVSIALLIHGVPSEILFIVQSPSSKQEIKWSA